MSIAAIALMMAGSTALACDTCGCQDKKADKAKTECEACKKEGKACKACEAKKAAAAKKTECPDCAK
jgi:hypothetical protein